MRRALVVAALAAFALVAASQGVEASTTTISASPRTAGLGQAVTFTAKYTSSCSGTIKPHYFTIDGKKVNGKFATSGQSGTETYTTASLTAGSHVVSYFWQTSTASCLGSATISYTVSKTRPKPSPSPLPKPSPSPTPSPSASPTSAPTSPTPVASVTKDDPDSPLAYLGVALIVVTVVAGIGLVVFGRRS